MQYLTSSLNTKIDTSLIAHIAFDAKGEPEMQKLHGVGKFFNKWWADPISPKKGNIVP